MRLEAIWTNKGERIDVPILQRFALLDSDVRLEIQPLAPLSMVSELLDSYYKTLNVPDKKMVCGLLENILGWHIDLADRKKIFKKLHKKRAGKMKKESEEVGDRGSTYFPLLMDFFDIQEICPQVTKVVFYDDLWKRAYRREDAVNGFIQGMEPFLDGSIKKIRKEVFETMREALKDVTVMVNINGTKQAVGFTSTGLKEAINQPHEHFVAKLEAVRKILTVLKKAKYVSSASDYEGRHFTFHYLKTKIAGEESFIVLKEDSKAGKTTLYTIKKEGKKKE
ncbi:MAG: type I-PGING CRISPR-associated protein Cas5p [Tannerellaceae bacterium]|jgi:CRISPR-associated protein Cas5|nr:type I-PGING CRISPR-associated protein Cas5p [Tannerellaceae bacterium]